MRVYPTDSAFGIRAKEKLNMTVETVSPVTEEMRPPAAHEIDYVAGATQVRKRHEGILNELAEIVVYLLFKPEKRKDGMQVT